MTAMVRMTQRELRRMRGEAARERTAERRAEVVRLTKLGVSAPEIARRLQTTQRQVVRDRKAMGISQSPCHDPLTPAEICRALELIDDGCPLNEVAATLGRGRATIARRFRGHSHLKVDPLKDCRELRKQLGLL